MRAGAWQHSRDLAFLGIDDKSSRGPVARSGPAGSDGAVPKGVHAKMMSLKMKAFPTPVALFLSARLPFEDFFASTPSTGPKVGDFT